MSYSGNRQQHLIPSEHTKISYGEKNKKHVGGIVRGKLGSMAFWSKHGEKRNMILCIVLVKLSIAFGMLDLMFT